MYKKLLLIGGLSMLMMLTCLPINAAASWPTNNENIEIVNATSVQAMPDIYCRYSYQQFRIDGQDQPKNVCINQSVGNLVIGAYLEKGRYYYVAGSMTDSILYSLQGCNGADICLYAPSQDTLFIKQHLVNSIVYGLTAYSDVSQKLQLSYDPYQQKRVYSIIGQPSYVFKNVNDYAWPIGGWALSSNERWLVFELRERGFAILDTDSLAVKRVSNKGFRYGQGMNPTTELAISGDGSTVAVMGSNAGARIITKTDSCGDLVDDEALGGNIALINPCIEVPLQINRWIENFLHGHLPKFDLTGHQLTLYASTRQGELARIVLQPKGLIHTSVDYLALGDSFSSGEGETDDNYYLPGTNAEYEKCHTSRRSYPFLVGQLSLTNESIIKNIACSGARIDDISGSEIDYWGQGQRQAENGLNLNITERFSAQQHALVSFKPGELQQEKFVELYRPGIVTIGIGGNDAGLFEKLKTCLMPGTCEWAETQERIHQTGKEIERLESRLIHVYQRLQQLSPSSQLYIVGYPQVITADSQCNIIGELLNQSERQFFINSIGKLNSVIQSAVAKSGMRYIDTTDVFRGHRLCEDATAVNSIRTGDDITPISVLSKLKLFGNESFHPTPFGHELLAEHISSSIANNVVATTNDNNEEYWQSSGNEAPHQMSAAMLSMTTLAPGAEVLLSLPAGTIQPHSMFTISVHSEPIKLVEVSANSDGSAEANLVIPSSLPEGFHTIHVNGRSYSGNAIDLYQSISYWSSKPTDNPVSLPEQEPSGTYETEDTSSITPASIIQTDKVPSSSAPSFDIVNQLAMQTPPLMAVSTSISRHPDKEVLAEFTDHDYQAVKENSPRTADDYIVIGALSLVFVAVLIVVWRLLLS